MASKHSVESSSQIAIGCQLCETNNHIKYKCIQCDLLICDICLKIHRKIANTHSILHVKQIGSKKITSTFNILKGYEVDMKHLQFMTISKDGTIYVADQPYKQLQQLRVTNDKIKVVSRFNIKVCGLAVLPSGLILIAEKGLTKLKSYDPTRNKFADTNFSAHPSYIRCVHVSQNGKILIGAEDGHGDNGVIIIMDQDGKHLLKYQKSNGKNIFKWPLSITTSSNGNIFVADCGVNQVVIIKYKSEIKYYCGQQDFGSTATMFQPVTLLRTPNDNILIMDIGTQHFHILSSEGDALGIYDPREILILQPYSLALSPSGNIFVGCISAKDSKAKLYELEYSYTL